MDISDENCKGIHYRDFMGIACYQYSPYKVNSKCVFEGKNQIFYLKGDMRVLWINMHRQHTKNSQEKDR